MSDDDTQHPSYILGERPRVRARDSRPRLHLATPPASDPPTQEPQPRPALTQEQWAEVKALAPFEILEILGGWYENGPIEATLGPPWQVTGESTAQFHARLVAGIYRLIGVAL